VYHPAAASNEVHQQLAVGKHTLLPSGAMKSSLACPKCDSRRLWRIEEFAAKDPSYSGGGKRPLMVAVAVRTPPTQEPGWFSDDGPERFDAGQVEAWVCAKCGYTELWSRDFEALRHLPESGVHLIDNTPQQSEYR
jgi:predicted nucleic-acid-binding Zn-ribbon protein